MTSELAGFWILFTSILLFLGVHARGYMQSPMGLLGIKQTRAGETRQGHLGRFYKAIARFVDGRECELPFFQGLL